jgi:hypothetical protein
MLACMVSSECDERPRMLLLVLEAVVVEVELEVKADDGAHADTL